MSEEKFCPGCGRHCNLEDPHCGRGEEYRRTGKMPERRCGEEHGKEDGERRRLHYNAADGNEKLIINLRDLGHIMRSQYEGKASQRRILIILSEEEKITQRDLTERLGVQPGSASEILSKLESAELISRTQNEADRRTTDICLTDAGRELAAQALAQRQKRHEEMFSCLSEEEKQELLSLLEKVCADWRKRYRGGRDGHGRHRHGEHDHHGKEGRCGEHGHHVEEGRRGEYGHHGEEGRRGEHGHHGEEGRQREHGHHEEESRQREHGHHVEWGPHGHGGN